MIKLLQESCDVLMFIVELIVGLNVGLIVGHRDLMSVVCVTEKFDVEKGKGKKKSGGCKVSTGS
jgi:hypothetical protein